MGDLIGKLLGEPEDTVLPTPAIRPKRKLDITAEDIEYGSEEEEEEEYLFKSSKDRLRRPTQGRRY